MAIEQKSDRLVIARLSEDPHFTDDINAIRTVSPVGNVVLDFNGVAYVNSANLSQLLVLRNHLNEHDRQLRLFGVSPGVWKLFVITGLNQLFDTSESEQLAIDDLKT